MGPWSEGPRGTRRNGKWILLNLGVSCIGSNWGYLVLSIWYEGADCMTVGLVCWN